MSGYRKVNLQDGGEAVLHPQLGDTMDAAIVCIKMGAAVHFQWDCLHCESRQVFETANTFNIRGKCEECGNTSDLLSPSAHVGFMMVAGSPMDAITALFGEEVKREPKKDKKGE